jgi:hypothetical protein
MLIREKAANTGIGSNCMGSQRDRFASRIDEAPQLQVHPGLK